MNTRLIIYCTKKQKTGGNVENVERKMPKLIDVDSNHYG